MRDWLKRLGVLITVVCATHAFAEEESSSVDKARDALTQGDGDADSTQQLEDVFQAAEKNYSLLKMGKKSLTYAFDYTYITRMPAWTSRQSPRSFLPVSALPPSSDRGPMSRSRVLYPPLFMLLILAGGDVLAERYVTIQNDDGSIEVVPAPAPADSELSGKPRLSAGPVTRESDENLKQEDLSPPPSADSAKPSAFVPDASYIDAEKLQADDFEMARPEKFYTYDLARLDSAERLRLRTFASASVHRRPGLMYPAVLTLDGNWTPVRLLNDIVYAYGPESWFRHAYLEGFFDVDPARERYIVVFSTRSDQSRRSVVYPDSKGPKIIEHTRFGTIELSPTGPPPV